MPVEHCDSRDTTVVRADSPHAAPPPSSEDAGLVRAARLAEALAAAWRHGDRPPAEDFLAEVPDAADRPELALVIIREELRLRRERGLPADGEEIRRRFPRWASELIRRPAVTPRAGAARGEPEFPEIGETFADCLLIAELGRGAAGRVFLATQPALADRPVVLKVTPCDGGEHLALARLQHTHIVPLLFARDFPGQNLRALAMPYLGGATWLRLAEALRPVAPAERTGAHLAAALDRVQSEVPLAGPARGPAREALAQEGYVEAVCRLGAELADALHYAHRRGFVHLDLKPGNVLLAGDGQPLLLDFHLARAPLAPGAPSAGWFGGTDGYMAPEQRQAFEAIRAGRPLSAGVDARADVYALGLVLYEMLGGVAADAEAGHVGRLRRHNPRVSRGLADILGHCLERDPRRRYPDAAALAADLRRHLAHEPLGGVPNRDLAERWRKWRRRSPQAFSRAGALAIAMLAAAVSVSAAVLRLDDYRRQAGRALAQGRALLARGHAAEAEVALAAGAEAAGRAPWAGGVAGALADELRRARDARALGELAAVADRLRFAGDAVPLSAQTARDLADSCDRLWQRREELLAAAEDLGGTTAASARENLLDLAVLCADLLPRAASASEAADARRRALQVLAQAEATLGGSAALAEESRRHAAALGDAAACSPAATAPPRTAWEHYALGRALLRDGRADEAAERFAAAVRLEPQGFWPNFYDGVCAYRRGRFADAAAAFRACVALAPRTAACYHNRAQALAALGRLDAAIADYGHALALEPGLGPSHLGRALCHHRAGRLDAALADLHAALERGADAATVHYNLSLIYQARNQPADAVRHLREALRHEPGHAPAAALLGRLQRQMGSTP